LKTLIQRTSSRLCTHCHTVLVGQYCHHCGQKKMTKRDLSLLHFLEQAVDTLTHVDSKFYQSLKYLIFKPGYLTSEFIRGRRIAYMKPVQLFLIINIIYFLAASVLNQRTFTTPLFIHLLPTTPYSAIAQSMVDHKIQQLGISLDEYEVHFNKNSTTFSKTLIFIMIPMFALLLQILYFRSKRFFVEHLVFSIHFFAFFLMVLTIGLPVMDLFIAGIKLLLHYDRIIITEYGHIGFVVAWLFIYLFISLRTCYKQSSLVSTGTSLFLTYSIMWILWLYRFTLFFASYYTT
jgi:hypothetical protein